MAIQRTNRQLLLALFVAFTAMLCVTPLPAKPAGKRGSGSAQDVLAARSEADKSHALIRLRQSLSAADALAIVRGDPSDAIAGMAAGIYLESGDAAAREAAEVLLALHQRYGLPGLAATQGATSGQVAAIVGMLATMTNRSRSANLLAADILATYATLLAHQGPERAEPSGKKGRGGGRKAAYLPAAEVESIRPTLERLLKQREPEVVEAAILASARLRLADLQGTIEARSDLRVAGVVAARLLYLASIGAGVTDEAIEQAFALAEVKPSSRGAETRLERLGSYVIRTAAGCYACEALGELGGPRHLERLYQALAHRDLRVQIDAARALERIGEEQSLPKLLAKLEDPAESQKSSKTPWPVLVHVLSALGSIPATSSIPPLIGRLQRETGRMRLDVNYALASITGKQHAETPEDWQAWWKENEATFRVDRQRTAKFRQEKSVQDMHVPRLGTFYGMEIFSDRAVFVLDTSHSMHGKKIESLKMNLTMTLEGLNQAVQYNVVDFGGVVSLMRPGGLISKPETPEVVQRVGRMTLSGGTRAFDALEVATALSGVDTLILLSDGAPVAGKFAAWQRLTAAVSIYNRHWPVAIWCLGFSASDRNTAAMGRLANRNYGQVRTSEL